VGARRKARELALQMLYQHELTGDPAAVIEAGFEEWKGAAPDVRRFASELVEGTLARLGEIDRELGRQTANWRLDRLAAVDRNILRLALYELMDRPETPAAVVIDEAIEIAKRFGSEDSGRFVNGVLDGFVKRRERAS